MTAVGSPFARARAMFAAIAGLIAAGATRATAVEAAGPYKSRGKGGGYRSKSNNTVAQAKRDAKKARNRAKHKRHCK
jgi:hypothetical protein